MLIKEEPFVYVVFPLSSIVVFFLNILSTDLMFMSNLETP